MVRFLVRALGLLLLAGGFVLAVVDGTQSIAQSQLAFRPLGATAFALFPKSFPVLEPAVTRHLHPFIWDPLLLNVLLLPTALVLFVLGLVLVWLARPPAPTIGFSSRDR